MRFERTWTGNWSNAFRGLRHPLESYHKSDSYFGFGVRDTNLIKAWFNNEKFAHIDKWNREQAIIDWLTDNGIIRVRGASTMWESYEENGVIKTKCSCIALGPNDLDLAQRMIKAGTPNDKFLRQIFVSVDITAPLYLWKELDTYKVGTTANSTSTMHKLASTPITLDCFETDDMDKELVIWEGKGEQSDYRAIDVFNDTILNCERLRKLYNETKDKRYWKELIRILPESWLQTRTFTCNYSVLRNIIHWRQGHRLSEWEQFIDWAKKELPYAEELLFYKQNIDNL